MRQCPKTGVEASKKAEIIRAVSEILQKEGFHVDCGRGDSAGIDCFFKRTFRLFEIKGGILIVCGKAGTGEVGYAVALKNSLGLDKMIVVARDGVEDEAKTMAENYGVALTDYESVVEKAGLLVGARSYYLRFSIDESLIHKKARSYKGFILRRGEYIGFVKSYLPIYVVWATLTRKHARAGDVLGSESVEVDVDLTSGSIVGVGDDGSLHVNTHVKVRVGSLSKLHATILSIIMEEGGSTYENLAERLGLSLSEVEHEVGVLIEMGLLEDVHGEILIARTPNIDALRGIIDTHKEKLVEGRPPADTNTIILPENVDADIIDSFVEVYGKIRGESIVYYPIAFLVFHKEKSGHHHYSYVVLDGLTGSRIEELEEALAHTGITDLLESHLKDSRNAERSEPARQRSSPTLDPEKAP